jgi:hypothetical protein
MHFKNAITPSMIALSIRGPFEEYAWFMVTHDRPSDAISDIADALRAVEFDVAAFSATHPRSLVATLHNRTVVLPTDTWLWPDEHYAALDQLRAPIREACPRLVWVTTPIAASVLVHSSPNFLAFFQPEIGPWSNGEMIDEERERHLTALRKQYGRSDDEIIRAAERGELRLDADHASWLILLGRGELVRDVP